MILGLDISTSITGITVLDKNGAMLYNESCDTRNKNHYPTLYQKASKVKNILIEIKEKFQIGEIYIEQSLQSFRSGFSSARTLSTLSRFNGIVSWMCYEIYDKEPTMIAASSARKSAGVTIKRGENSKERVFQFVVDNEPDFIVEYTRHGNPKPGAYDRADSYIIAKAGYINWKMKS